MNNKIKIAYSPCPNDTFIFYKLSQDPNYQVSLQDIDLLNKNALEGIYDITKMSFYAWLKVKNKYDLINSGSALGKGCGPLVVSKNGKGISNNSLIAIPGEYTTANLLYKLCYGDLGKCIYMPYSKIMDALDNNKVDVGVIIHEGRFVFKDKGFVFEKDLGEWWEGETNLPIPLGCIAVKKNLGKEAFIKAEQDVYRSIRYAQKNRHETKEYIKKHAQEMEDKVIDSHINLYVNNFTLKLDDTAYLSINEIEKRAMQLGLIK